MQTLDNETILTPEQLRLVAREYPSINAVKRELAHIEALLPLPKRNEYFMSDLHGEDQAFVHIINSAFGFVRKKVDKLFETTVSEQDRDDLITLIYYPDQKLPELRERQTNLTQWYRTTLNRLRALCQLLVDRYNPKYVHKRLTAQYSHVLERLLNTETESQTTQVIEDIIRDYQAEAYIMYMCEIIRRLAAARLHIVGDLFDRGPHPELIMDALLGYPDLDFQWGNHDVLWMGAASGSPICVMTAVKNSLSYSNLDFLEHGYGISLNTLRDMANRVYAESDVSLWRPKDASKGGENWEVTARMHKAVTIIMFKLECQVIARNPDFLMEGRDFLNRIDYKTGTVERYGKVYPLLNNDFPTVDPSCPSQLTRDEEFVLGSLVSAFRLSQRLQQHVRLLYEKGSLYACHNGNLLMHGAVPMTNDGEFVEAIFEGQSYSGKSLFGYCERRARQGYYAPDGSPERQRGQDFLWYLWCGALSPVFVKSVMATFETLYIADKETHKESKNPYYTLVKNPEIVDRILAEFGLSGSECHIINGHVPVKAAKGESPVTGGGKVLDIDGGFAKPYQSKTGIAGYMLLYNSWGFTLRTLHPMSSMEEAIHEDRDIDSYSEYIYTAPRRLTIQDTDDGQAKMQRANKLQQLLKAYESGEFQQTV